MVLMKISKENLESCFSHQSHHGILRLSTKFIKHEQRFDMYSSYALVKKDLITERIAWSFGKVVLNHVSFLFLGRPVVTIRGAFRCQWIFNRAASSTRDFVIIVKAKGRSALELARASVKKEIKKTRNLLDIAGVCNDLQKSRNMVTG